MKKLAIIPAAVAALALAGSVASAQTPAVVVKTPAPHKGGGGSSSPDDGGSSSPDDGGSSSSHGCGSSSRGQESRRHQEAVIALSGAPFVALTDGASDFAIRAVPDPSTASDLQNISEICRSAAASGSA